MWWLTALKVSVTAPVSWFLFSRTAHTVEQTEEETGKLKSVLLGKNNDSEDIL